MTGGKVGSEKISEAIRGDEHEQQNAESCEHESELENIGPRDRPESSLKQIDNHRHLILVRSMTKFYALPGLRLGYGIMHPGWIEKLESRRPPWSINSIAQAVGKSALGDKEFPGRVREFIRKERNFLYEGLKEIPALEVFSSDANFLLFRLREGTERESKALYSSLLGEGLLVRNCGNFHGLDHRYFRVAVKNRRENTNCLSIGNVDGYQR